MRTYKTDNLALASYLLMNGLRYTKTEPGFGKYDKMVVNFLFEDPHGVAQDLSVDFMRSEIKTYRECFFYLRNEIEKLKRQLSKMQLDESRKTDDKYYTDGEIDENKKSN